MDPAVERPQPISTAVARLLLMDLGFTGDPGNSKSLTSSIYYVQSIDLAFTCLQVRASESKSRLLVRGGRDMLGCLVYGLGVIWTVIQEGSYSLLSEFKNIFNYFILIIY